MDLLHEEKEPIEWMSLHVGAERGVNCEHMQGLLTNLLQKHWEWQENRRKDLEPGKFKYKTMYFARLDVKTAFHVAKPSVLSKILSLIDTHSHVVAALLAEMQDVKGSACFENCETDFRYSKCIQQGGRGKDWDLGHKDPALDIWTQDATGRRVGYIQSKNCSYGEIKVEENGLVFMTELCAEKVWKTMAWAVYEGEVPVLYTYGQVGRIGGRLDTEVESGSSQEGRGDSYPIHLSTLQVKKAVGGIPLRKRKRSGSLDD